MEVISILRDQPNNFNDKDPEYLTKFIELCNVKGYLTHWSVALKISGSSKPGLSKESAGLRQGLKITNVELAKRSGPKKRDDIGMFFDKNLFRASGKSANIISSNEDMAILLSPQQRTEARNSFYAFKANELKRKDDRLSNEEAHRKAREEFKTIPERYYREKMSETEGLLMIYLFDSRYSFNQLGVDDKRYPTLKKEFNDYVVDSGLESVIKTTPLVGYAIEFPPIKKDPGGTYLKGDYDIGEDADGYDNEDEIEAIPDYNDL